MSGTNAKRYDIAVLGAGPAGLSAATEAAARGASVVVLDEQARPGGQIYRNVEIASARQRDILGSDYLKGAGIGADFRASDADYRPGCTIWDVTRSGQVVFSSPGSQIPLPQW